MKYQLKNCLVSAMQEWVDECRELDELYDCDFCSMTICRMADAAAAVYDAIVGTKELVKCHSVGGEHDKAGEHA